MLAKSALFSPFKKTSVNRTLSASYKDSLSASYNQHPTGYFTFIISFHSSNNSLKLSIILHILELCNLEFRKTKKSVQVNMVGKWQS